MLTAALTRWRVRRLRSSGIRLSRRMTRAQGSARRKRSARRKDKSVQRFRCLTWSPRSSRRTPPADRSRTPSSMSSTDGLGIGLVEAADGDESAPPHGAAGSPEARGLRARRLVHVVVKEVAILRDESGGGGVVVIGADDRGQAGRLREGRDHAPDEVGRDHDVAVEEEDHVARRRPRPRVARGRRPRPSRSVDEHAAGGGGEVFGARDRPVAGEDRFQGRRIRGRDRTQAGVEGGPGGVGGDHHRHAHRRPHAHPAAAMAGASSR